MSDDGRDHVRENKQTKKFTQTQKQAQVNTFKTKNELKKRAHTTQNKCLVVVRYI